jgi:hypothetical protein
VAEGRKGGGHRRRWLGGVAGLAGLAAGVVGVTLWLVRGRGAGRGADARGRESADRWARPGMEVTFRAELMPGRSRAERTYRVAELLANDRVTLAGVAGEHSETEFEAAR